MDASSDIQASPSTTVKETANAHTATSAWQQGSFVDTAASSVSRLFVSSCESPYISLEDSLHGSPRLSPQPTMSGSPYRQSLFAPSATGLQEGQFTSKHFNNRDPRVQHLLKSIIQKHDVRAADT